MPFYKYTCDCGLEKEVLKSIAKSDEPEICECGKQMTKQICNTNFIIHGHSYNNTYNKKPIIDVKV